MKKPEAKVATVKRIMETDNIDHNLDEDDEEEEERIYCTLANYATDYVDLTESNSEEDDEETELGTELNFSLRIANYKSKSR